MTIDEQQFLAEYVYYKDPNGVLYPLFGGKRVLMSWEGAGMPSWDYLRDRGPGQHGTTVRDYRSPERTLTLQMYERGNRRPDWWSNEYGLIDAIRPNRSSTNQTGYILIINPNNVQREIPARILNGPQGDWIGTGDQVPSDLLETLFFLCDDPFWRDPDQNRSVFTINPTGTCLPTCLPTCLGGSGVISSTVDIAYTGTWEGDQITITYAGPMVSPVITNTTTNKEIKLNYTISVGETVTITILPNLVTVKNNSDTELIGVVQNISDLVDFKLATAGDLTSDGTNTIRISTVGGDSATTSISFEYYTRDVSLFGV